MSEVYWVNILPDIHAILGIAATCFTIASIVAFLGWIQNEVEFRIWGVLLLAAFLLSFAAVLTPSEEEIKDILTNERENCSERN